MINCEECAVEIRAETHKPPIWGVQVVHRSHVKSFYFCSKEHGDKWVKRHSSYKLVGMIVDA